MENSRGEGLRMKLAELDLNALPVPLRFEARVRSVTRLRRSVIPNSVFKNGRRVPPKSGVHILRRDTRRRRPEGGRQRITPIGISFVARSQIRRRRFPDPDICERIVVVKKRKLKNI